MYSFKLLPNLKLTIFFIRFTNIVLVLFLFLLKENLSLTAAFLIMIGMVQIGLSEPSIMSLTHKRCRTTGVSDYLVKRHNNNGLRFKLDQYQVLLKLKCFYSVKYRTLR